MRSMDSPGGRRVCIIHAKTEQSNPPENKTAIRGIEPSTVRWLYVCVWGMVRVRMERAEVRIERNWRGVFESSVLVLEGGRDLFIGG
jgi:hypothetical protein